MLLIQTVWAVRAKTFYHAYTQSDGTALTLTLAGDEHFHWYQDREGICYELLQDGQDFRRLPAASLNAGLKQAARTRTRTRNVGDYRTQWDANRTYRQAVILVAYNDQDFGMDDPHGYYDNLFNKRGLSYRSVSGCVAEYLRDQSRGMCNIVFDVYGPVRIARSAKSSGTNYGSASFRMATQKAIDSLHVDFAPYDWDGDREVEQVIFVSAGYCANGGSSKTTGYVWPNTSVFSTVTTDGGLRISEYSASAEKWFNDIPCGIGTILHEFSHNLGLPDLYPTNVGSYSVVDEWDLMDGGNYTDWGWCPPNYSVMEKMLLGWLTPEEISQPVSIIDMKPLQDGGQAYRISMTDSQYYLLENRQQHGWDAGLPGRGLLITRVDYDGIAWANNRVNDNGVYHYDIVRADGMSYDDWDEYVKASGLPAYADSEHNMNRLHLSTAAFPLISDTREVRSCELSSWAVTDVGMTEDGLVSFEVTMATAIGSPSLQGAVDDDEGKPWYDLQGRRLQGQPARKGLYIRNHKKYLR